MVEIRHVYKKTYVARDLDGSYGDRWNEVLKNSCMNLMETQLAEAESDIRETEKLDEMAYVIRNRRIDDSFVLDAMKSKKNRAQKCLVDMNNGVPMDYVISHLFGGVTRVIEFPDEMMMRFYITTNTGDIVKFFPREIKHQKDIVQKSYPVKLMPVKEHDIPDFWCNEDGSWDKEPEESLLENYGKGNFRY